MPPRRKTPPLLFSLPAGAWADRLRNRLHGRRPLVPDGDRIDWILATAGVTVHSATINTYE
ncbi:hypothetical protein [Streptomyces sp. NPDC059262]|uniref:hypothetical protein n=1 Tax=Streptomyces sp. NPDC059262 TaxID=3346797 RepID=UPI003685F0CD